MPHKVALGVSLWIVLMFTLLASVCFWQPHRLSRVAPASQPCINADCPDAVRPGTVVRTRKVQP